MNLDFLKDVTVSAAPVAAKPAPVSRVKQRQPEGDNVIRLFKDGSVYPSDHLIAVNELEYGKRDEKGKPTGFGIDVVDSRDMTSQFQTPVPFVGFAFVPRSEGKVDLFASTKYGEDGAPTASVATQGAATYGKEQLIPLLQEVYGADFTFNEEGYVDLQILGQEFALTSPDGRFFIFKRISRGPNQGKKDYAVRVDVAIYPVIPITKATDAVTSPETGDTEAATALAEVEVARKADNKKAKKDTTDGSIPANPFEEETEEIDA